jgi:pimeloyl-ACP methyl ester carboxylesterase
MRSAALKTLLLLCLLLLAVTGVSAQANMTALLDELGGTACPEGDFTCVTLALPLDHANPENGETIDVTFAVLPASGESRGIFVTVVGGPGGSGLAVADFYSSYFAPEIFENFDIVFFDQRGIGASGGLDCPQAVAAYGLDTARPTTPEGEAAVIAAARTFAQDCMVEMNADTWLPYLGTEQALQDLEAFRMAVGAPRMWLYGESYGTQFAQEYAAAYPDVIDGLILDGVVDLTLTGEDYYVGQTQAFSDALTATLQACATDAACLADFGGDPFAAIEVYDDLTTELLTAPITVGFPLPDGEREPRQYTIAMLESSAAGAVYGRDGRAYFLRTLAAAAQGDLLPLLRLGYQDTGIDPLTQEVVVDTSYSSGMYYGVECNDYRFGSGTPDENAAAFMAAGDLVEAQVERLDIIYYTDLPCVFWNVEGRAERPAPLEQGDYVTFILNSNLDPATPISNGYAVFERMENAYMITDDGGPHVIFGRDLDCPDVAITAWMVDGVLPPAREFVCAGDVIQGYEAVPPRLASAYTDGVSLLQAVDTEMMNLPEYVYWDGAEPLEIGCSYGGSLTYVPTDEGETMTFAACELFNDVVLEGTGEWIYGVTFSITLQVSGAINAELSYLEDESFGGEHYSGTFNGQPVAAR